MVFDIHNTYGVQRVKIGSLKHRSFTFKIVYKSQHKSYPDAWVLHVPLPQELSSQEC
uniref:Uncharacterized protein n=1 Tax=Arundo donax TaxID=35708 RepID=A0A0A8Y5K5_ARUDO